MLVYGYISKNKPKAKAITKPFHHPMKMSVNRQLSIK